LVVGNSRLGRVKIPSCIACDRPLIDKVRLDTLAGSSSRVGSASHSMLGNYHGGGGGMGGLGGGMGGGVVGGIGGGGNPMHHNTNNTSLTGGSQVSYGYNAANIATNSVLMRGGESDDDEPPASGTGGEGPRTLLPLTKKPNTSNNKKRTAHDGGARFPDLVQ
jgi:hypothetical protein